METIVSTKIFMLNFETLVQLCINTVCDNERQIHALTPKPCVYCFYLSTHLEGNLVWAIRTKKLGLRTLLKNSIVVLGQSLMVFLTKGLVRLILPFEFN